MKKNAIIHPLAIIICCLVFVQCQQTPFIDKKDLSIIPQPDQLELSGNVFRLNADTKIWHEEGLETQAKQLADLLPIIAFPLDKVGKVGEKNTIALSLDKDLSDLGAEGYTLNVKPQRIHISAAEASGIFYGIQTLRQLLPSDIEKTETSGDGMLIPCLSIRDNPRFNWRGLMLDCSRTFWSKDYIKRTIRLMSLYKLNVLHLHLTDDQGWRVEIKKYPELTQKGAQFPEKWNEPKERQGYYSQEDIREIVDYAQQHNITIVPEIEMPGHTLAVLACYPELSCAGGPFEIHPFFKGPGIHEDIFCAGNDKVFEFLEDVLTEVIELFPGEYLHIGGDEAPKKRWENCEKCQDRIKAEGLENEHELQAWFIKRIEAFINSKGKKLIGWDEIMEGGLSETATVMYWRGWIKDVPEKVVLEGNKIVMSPTSHCYFDYKYETISTMHAYAFEPVAEGMPQEQSKNVLGVQANFWSHIDRTEAGVDKQLFPRLLSIAEIGWSPKEKRDSLYFKEKVNKHLPRLDLLGVNCYPDSTVVR